MSHGEDPRRIRQREIDEACQKWDGYMCYTTDWFEEDLPMENKEGTAMWDALAEFLEKSQEQDPVLEYIVEPEKKWDVPKIEVPKAKAESVLVFSDHHGFCDVIMKDAPEGRVGKKKIVNQPVEAYSEGDIKALLKPGWDLVIVGFGLDPPETNCSADVAEHSLNLSRALFYILQQICMNPSICKRLCVLTRGQFAHDEKTHGEVGLGLISAGTFYGMLNTARLEIGMNQDVPIQLIDLDYNLHLPQWNRVDWPMVAPRMVAEVWRRESFGHNTVRITQQGRYVQRQLPTKEYEVAKEEFELPDPGDIVGISGGNGALAIVMGQWMLQKCEEQGATGFTIHFLSRSMKISDQNMPGWKAIEKKAAELGIHVEQAKMNMSSQEGVDEYVQRCNGKLTGFIHSAGVLADKVLPNQTWDDFLTVFNSKHVPALYLHESLQKFEQDDMKFVWLFSSIAAHGSPSQINYSGSNSFLDALSRHRCALGVACMSVQWGAWGEVGMAATMGAAQKRRIQEGIFPYFLTKEGMQGLDMGLSTNLPNFTVLKYNTKKMAEANATNNSVTACYTRNFCWRCSHGPYTEQKENAWIFWNTYVAPNLPDEERHSTEGYN